MAIKLQPDKDRNKYVNQIYGGSPPSMDYYRQLGATKRANEEAVAAAKKAQREAESAAKKAATDAKKAEEKAAKEAEKEAKKKAKEAEEKKKTQDLLDLLGGFNENKTTATVKKSDAASSSTKKKSGGFLSNIAGLGKDVAGDIFHVGKTAAKGVGQLAKVAFTDYTMDDMRNAAKKQADVNKQKFTPYSDKHSSKLSQEVYRAADRAGNAATFGLLEDSRRNLDLGTKAFDSRSGVGAAADVGYDLLGSLVPGGAIVKGMQGTKLAANLTKDLTRTGRMAQRAKEGSIAGALYSSADAGISEALDPNRRGMPDHLKNIALETLFGGVADPAIGGIFDALGKGAGRALSNTNVVGRRTRELASNLTNPNPMSAPNVLSQAPLPEVNLGNSYRSIPTVRQPEFNIGTNNVPDLQTRVNQLDTLIPQHKELSTTLEQSRNTFVDDFVNRYQNKLPNNEKEVADGAMQWDVIKQQRDDYDNIRKKIDKFYIPKEHAEEYRGLFPRSFLNNANNGGMDVFSAAQAFGFSGDHEGVLKFGQMLRALQESKTIKKGDIVPKETGKLTPKDLEEVRKVGDVAFPETEDYQAIKPLLDAFDADIKSAQNPDILGNLNIQANAPKANDPLATLATLKPKPEPTPKVGTPSRKPETTEGVMESPIARREETSLFEKIKGVPRLLKRMKDRAKYEIVSEYQPAKDVERIIAKMDTDNILARTPHGDLDVSDSFFKGLRNANRSSRVAAESIERGYAPIVEDINRAGIKIADFEEYALAKHANDIYEHNAAKAEEVKQILTELQTVKIGSQRALELEAKLEPLKDYHLPKEATPEWAASTIKKWEGNEAMTKAQQAFVKEQQKDLMILQKSGRYSKEQVNAMMAAHPNYVSMRREVEGLTDAGQRGTSSTPGRVGEPFRRRKEGSLDKVLPPLESAMQSRIRAIDTAMKNQALQKIEKLVKVDGAEQFFKPLKESDPIFGKITNKVRFFKNGQEVYYEIPEELGRMFDNIGKGSVDNPAFKALEQLTVFSKKGMTHYNPTFLVKSPVRDTINAIFTSRSGISPVDVMGGFLDATAGKQLSKLTGGRFKTYNDVFKEMGGDFSSFISMDINDIARVQKSMQSGKVGNGFEVLNPFKAMEKFGAAMERAPRLAEFRSAKRQGYSDEGAIFEATDVIDYSDLGATIKKLNRVAPYLGATIRGNLRVLQAFKENPKKAIGRGIVSITLPTIGLYSLRFNENVSEKQRAKIQNMPDWQKNTFWAVPDITGNSDKVYMIPKGFLVTQIFANPVERALDQVFGGEHKTSDKLMKETIEDFKTALTPPTAIAGITTISQIARNQDDFLGIPIENEDMQKKDRSERFDARTSELAKVMGKMMGLSPAKLDFFIKGTTGGLGRDVLDLGDNLAKEAGVDRPAKTRTNAEILNPFDQFQYDDMGSSRYAEELYQADQKEATRKSDIRADFKARTGVSMPSDDRGRSEVGQYYDLFRDINREISNVREDKVMSPAEKRDTIASLRDEQRDLGVRLTDQGVLANQDQSLQDMEKHLNDLGSSAKATKGDVRDVLREQLLKRGHDRQQVDTLLRNVDKDQMISLLEQLR